MAAGKLFGTDGIRGNVNQPPLLPENLSLLGRILGAIVQNRKDFSELRHSNNLITVGRDTRASGTYLESALVAGICSMGVDCELVGILPTAAVAQAAMRSNACFGIIVSASHNPFCDNGIKIFGPMGTKIDEALELFIEHSFNSPTEIENLLIASSPGKVCQNAKALNDHINLLRASVDSSSFEGMKLVIDCANGAASSLAPQLFSTLTSSLFVIGNNPDGTNINDRFGSEAPERITSAVLEHKADLGIAFDGDADRVIFSDECGQIIDGDAILAILAIHCLQRGLLAKNTLVATIMSSVALDRALAPQGISVLRTQVGDKFVARAMLQGGFNLGGENSGHIILFPHASTGDGVLSALLLLEILAKSNSTISRLVSFFKPVPKLLKSIPVNQKLPMSQMPKTQLIIDKLNAELQEGGRILLRYSGTENKARLLVEAESDSRCQNIADIITKQFGDEIYEISGNTK